MPSFWIIFSLLSKGQKKPAATFIGELRCVSPTVEYMLVFAVEGRQQHRSSFLYSFPFLWRRGCWRVESPERDLFGSERSKESSACLRPRPPCLHASLLLVGLPAR